MFREVRGVGSWGDAVYTLPLRIEALGFPTFCASILGLLQMLKRLPFEGEALGCTPRASYPTTYFGLLVCMVRTAGYSEKYVPRQTWVGDDPLGRVKAI